MNKVVRWIAEIERCAHHYYRIRYKMLMEDGSLNEPLFGKGDIAYFEWSANRVARKRLKALNYPRETWTVE